MRAAGHRRPSIRRRTTAAVLATAVGVTRTGGRHRADRLGGAGERAVKYSCGARNGDPATSTRSTYVAGLIGSTGSESTSPSSPRTSPSGPASRKTSTPRFTWSATLDQTLIDGAAGLIPQIADHQHQWIDELHRPLVRDVVHRHRPEHDGAPDAGQKSSLNLGSYGGPITTTGGGIITYRVGRSSSTRSCRSPAPVTSTSSSRARSSVRTSSPRPPSTTPTPRSSTPRSSRSKRLPARRSRSTCSATSSPRARRRCCPRRSSIAEQPTGGSATISDGVFSYTAPPSPASTRRPSRSAAPPSPTAAPPASTRCSS